RGVLPLSMRRTRPVLLALAFALLAGPLSAQPRDCSTLGQVTWVDSVFHDLYYWYRDVPTLNPALFNSPEAYVEAARFRPLDTTFSFVTSQAADQALIGESQYIGYGFGNWLVATDDLRVTQVYPGSPADDAGMARGQRILEIDGRTIAD